MKFEVMPIIEMRHMACMARVTVKDAPRAPNAGPGILTGGRERFFGFGFGEGFGLGALGEGSGDSGWEASSDGFGSEALDEGSGDLG